jgi:hypothetical protein
MDLEKIRKALGRVATAGDPGQLDPAVGPGGGTHNTDVEIADDVVKLVDTNSPDTPDLETRAYEGGTEDDGSADTPPYDGDASVDGNPVIPDTMAATGGRGNTKLGGPIGGDPQGLNEDANAIEAQEDADAGDAQKNSGGGGPSVQLPDTLEDELSVAPNDPHASVQALTTDDIADLRKIMAEDAESNIAKAVKALQWLDRNPTHAQRQQVRAGLDAWKPAPEIAREAQARYGFEFLHTEAAATPENAAQTTKVLSWLKKFVTARKITIASEFLKSTDAASNPELAAQIQSWMVEAVDQVNENKEDVGIDDITLYGPQNDSPSHKPAASDEGFTEPKVVSLDDVPFLDPERHPAQAGSEVDEQTGTPAEDGNAVDGDSFDAKGHDRGKETNLPTAAKQATAMPPMDPMAAPPAPVEAPPVPGMPDPMADPLGMQPPVDPMAMDPMAMDPMAQDPMGLEAPPEMPMGDEGIPGIPPVLPEGEPELPMEGMDMGGGAPPMAPAAGPDAGMEQSLEQWLQQELMAPEVGMDPAESAHVEMLSNFEDIGIVAAEDVVMSLYNADQENPHWNIDISGRPVARVELAAQPKPEEVRSTFLSGPYAENIAQAMAKVGVVDVLSAINAKPYAAKIEAGKLAEKIRAKVESEMEEKLAEAVGNLRDRFMTAARIALAGYNNNFFRGEDHQLKAAIWSELGRIGVRDAAGLIEASFDEGSVPFFESVMSKAEELMDLPDEARDAIAKAIPESNSLVEAGASTGNNLPMHEDMASQLEAGNMPFTNPAAPVVASRGDVTAGLRQRVRLSTFRSS